MIVASPVELHLPGVRSYPALRIIALILKGTVALSVAAHLYVVFGMGTDGPAAAILLLPLISVGALLVWAIAELILVFANGGEDLGSLLTVARATLEATNHLVESSRRAGSAAAQVSPAFSEPPRASSPAAEVNARDEPVAVAINADPKRQAKLRAQREGDGKCTECGVALNFARLSIEKKTTCPSCEASHELGQPHADS